MGDGSFGRLTAVHKPLYQQVREILLERIKAGAWRHGQPLPNEHTLAGELDVSIGTVRRAIEGLERNGILRRKQGSGTFLTAQGWHDGGRFAFPLHPVDAHRGRLATETLEMRTRRMSEPERQLFDARIAGEVIEACALIMLDGRPVAHERSLVPVARLPVPVPGAACIEDIRALLSEHGLAAQRCVDAVGLASSVQDAAVLGDLGAEPLLECRRTAYSADSRPVEHRILVFRPSALQYVGRVG